LNSSPSISFDDLICVPRPDNPDDIPIWYGSAFSPRMVRRVARFGQGWMPFVGPEQKPLEMMARGVAALAEEVPALAAAGVNHLRVQVSMFAGSLDHRPEVVRTLVKRVAELG
jgi:alkanesulfonate monooxygenase SsuD/methylene tetrahydromethanopterin reductase-like flavin-dependent oxidoreductase (luciferase family)